MPYRRNPGNIISLSSALSSSLHLLDIGPWESPRYSPRQCEPWLQKLSWPFPSSMVHVTYLIREPECCSHKWIEPELTSAPGTRVLVHLRSAYACLNLDFLVIEIIPLPVYVPILPVAFIFQAMLFSLLISFICFSVFMGVVGEYMTM